MALFKVTTKRLILNPQGKRIEAGVSAEVQYNGSILPLIDMRIRNELTRQFKVKYDIDFPAAYMNSGYLEVTKL